MALTNDNSNRIIVFEGFSPIKNTEKYVSLKKTLTESHHTTIVDGRTVNEIFSAIKDPFSGYTLSSSHEQFIYFCKQNNLRCVFSDEAYGFLVTKK